MYWAYGLPIGPFVYPFFRVAGLMGQIAVALLWFPVDLVDHSADVFVPVGCDDGCSVVFCHGIAVVAFVQEGPAFGGCDFFVHRGSVALGCMLGIK